MDSYQAIYDAARSKIGGADVGDAIESAIREVGIGHYFQMALSGLQEAGGEMSRPSAVYRPSLYVDGNKWCALYGENIQDGVCGFGDSPDKAMREFDDNWNRRIDQTNV